MTEIVVQFLAGARGKYLLQNVEIGSRAHSVTYSVGAVASFPRGEVAMV